MQLRNVSFTNWLRSHNEKDPEERWLRELYPWPVLAQVEFDESWLHRPQRITYDDVKYDVTLTGILWQDKRGTFRYRLVVESDGLGWHSRSFADEFYVCAAPDGSFVTLYHAKKEEPLEKIARAFFGRRWADINPESFRTLAVSRFLAASIVVDVAEDAFHEQTLTHYPGARLVGDAVPMLASGDELWLGYRFYSEAAYAWARRNAGKASRVIALYFADTKHQFRTDLPAGVEVHSIAQIDADLLGGQHSDLIRTLLRGLELPTETPAAEELERIVRGEISATPVSVREADVHEALAALKSSCQSKAELRYQLAAAVVLNAWIESERRLGYSQRKKFYAFKHKVEALANWVVAQAQLPGVRMWAEPTPLSRTPALFIRVDDVDFSFHAIPIAERLHQSGPEGSQWKGVRLKPIAPLVLAWARRLRSEEGSNSQPSATAGG